MCRWDDDDGRPFDGTEVADGFGFGGDGEYSSGVASGDGDGGCGGDGGSSGDVGTI